MASLCKGGGVPSGGYTAAVPRRAILAFALAAAVLSWPLGSGASIDRIPSGHQAAGQDNGKIILRAKFHEGPWKKSLYLKLVKLRLIDFQVCAIWNHPVEEAFDCNTAYRSQLPAGTSMRLEQNPVARALRRADSPGWGMLGSSAKGALGAVVSNLLSGNRKGTFRYRVTLRDRSNEILATSNTFTVIWH